MSNQDFEDPFAGIEHELDASTPATRLDRNRGMTQIPDDISIPAFLIATGPGTPHQAAQQSAEQPQVRAYGPSCWEEMQRESDVTRAVELKAAFEQYEAEKRFAAFQQWCIENPELARMNAKAKRDAERRIAKLGVKPAGRRMR